MHFADYMREQALQYRRDAANAPEGQARQEILELAEACEEVANEMDDRGDSRGPEVDASDGVKK